MNGKEGGFWLSVSEFSAGYDGQKLFKNLSFSLEAGTLTALIGENGCGKSTLLKGICRLIPAQGQVLLHQGAGLGEEPDVLPLHTFSHRRLARCVSYIPQRSDPAPALSVLDMVLMGFHSSLHLLESPGSAHRAEASAALALVGLDGAEKKDYRTLSEGQKQLVILARTLVQDSNLWLLDEPDSALDFVNRHRMLGLLRRIAAGKQRAGLLVLHDPGLALAYCDQLLLMKDGRILDTLHPAEDSEARMTRAFSALYGAVRILRQDGHCVLIPEYEF